MSLSLRAFDEVLDGFYLVLSARAGKCLACGAVIPEESRGWPLNRAWLIEHWKTKLRRVDSNAPTSGL